MCRFPFRKNLNKFEQNNEKKIKKYPRQVNCNQTYLKQKGPSTLDEL